MLHGIWRSSPKLRIKQMSKGTREKVQLILVMSRAGPAVSAGRAHRRRGPRHPGLYSSHTILSNYNPECRRGDLHPPDRRRGEGAGRGDLHQPGRIWCCSPVRGSDPRGKGHAAWTRCSGRCSAMLSKLLKSRIPGHRTDHAAGVCPAAGVLRGLHPVRPPAGPVSREHGVVRRPDGVCHTVRRDHLRYAAADPGADGVPVL